MNVKRKIKSDIRYMTIRQVEKALTHYPEIQTPSVPQDPLPNKSIECIVSDDCVHYC